ncbi:hypothetical protein QBC35DRAFT_179626 [Podospora australis]|uniref:Rho-GAP domain-containing protein n=1 Tax=Podospora australis TaxID=1536484 RepID=A0AAN6WUZ8_9PEZI|nr:hypothetical protein QBC35DRAFT_179626 [Podospora australis]
MSDILDTRDGLREQLTAALLGWSGEVGGGGRSRNQEQHDNNNCNCNCSSSVVSVVSDPATGSGSGSGSDSGSGSITPIARQHVYIRNLMDYADQGPKSRFLVNDDIDADSDDPGSNNYFHAKTVDIAIDADAGLTEEEGTRRYRQPTQLHQYHMNNITATMDNNSSPSPPQHAKPLPPIPPAFDTTLSSSQGSAAQQTPEMSCRISTFPFSHPCDIPELMPDCQEDADALNSAPSPLASGPATPSVVNDVFRPLTDAESPVLDFGPFSPTMTSSAEAENHQQFLYPQQPMRKPSLKTLVSEMSDGLGIIEEEDDVNTDGVSMLTPTEASFGTGAGDSIYDRFSRVDSRGFHQTKPRSLSSSAGSTGSSEWRPSTKGGESRKSINLFSRIRGGRNTIVEEPLEKRSLTPWELNAPSPRQDSDEMLPPQSSASSMVQSSIHSRVETTVNSRFFSRMNWLSDSAPQTGSVFGIDLNSSIKLAPMKIRVSHRGRSTSYRTYPLSIYKCCEFIRKEGLKDGNIFCAPGNALNVAQLKEIFNRPPTYGENFTFEGTDYTPFDAARLILLYLEELPKPIISSSVLRCWILLARQEGAIEPPCPRIETGLDFWTEALSRLSTTARSLVKHLLGVFAECLMTASPDNTITEADARHFASAVSRALFHHENTDASVVGSTHTTVTSISSAGSRRRAGKKNVYPTLALAFLIKKRGEYSTTLGRATAASAARRDTKFLPSTKEMMQWKGLM